jgi:acyl-CoA synthetase (AMP-forming)/AMP-acid ligase II
MDDDGYVSIVGRIKDMIIRGGENIYPREIEEFLPRLAGVADAHVIGVPASATARRSWPGSSRAGRDAHRGELAPPAAGGSRRSRSRATGSSSTTSR